MLRRIEVVNNAGGGLSEDPVSSVPIPPHSLSRSVAVTRHEISKSIENGR